jgi:cell division protein FtsA
LVLADLENEGYAGRLPAGAILTGGGAHLAGAVELTREVLAMPVRSGMPERGISGLLDSVQAPRYAVPVGLALWGARQRLQGTLGSSAAVERLFGPVKRWLQDFF